jgi:hypothetical protein
MASSRRASSEIRQVMHTQAPRDVSQSLPIHREKSAQQSTVTEFLDPRPPTFGAAAKPVEFIRPLGRDRGPVVAKRVAGERPAFPVRKLEPSREGAPGGLERASGFPFPL